MAAGKGKPRSGSGAKKVVGKAAKSTGARGVKKSGGAKAKAGAGRSKASAQPARAASAKPKGKREEIRVAFVPGIEPDRFIRRWRDLQRERIPAERAVASFEPIPISQQEAALREYDMVLVRLPLMEDRLLDRCHCVNLWTERPVVVVSKDNDLAAAEDDVTSQDLVHAGVLLAEDSRDDAKDRVEIAATGVGYAPMPMSLARLHNRKDVTYRVVSDWEPTQIALVWHKEKDRPALQDMVGLMRGRKAHSSRG